MEPDRSKVFVGGIPWETNEDSLKDYFRAFGDVVEATIMKDRATGRARGFAFVEFADAYVAEKVIHEKHSIDGRAVEVKKAVRREENQAQSRTNSTSGITALANTTKTKKIFVGGLASTVSDEDFKQYFEQFGTTTDVVVMYDHNTQRPRGFGFITFDSEDAVERAVQERTHELNGKKVEVKKAVPKELLSSRQGCGPERSTSFGMGYVHSNNASPSPGYGSPHCAPPSGPRGLFSPYGPPFGSPGYGPQVMGYGIAMNGGFGGPAYYGPGYPSGPYAVGFGGGPAAGYVGVPAGHGTTPPSPVGIRSPWSHPGSGYAGGASSAYGVGANGHSNTVWRPGNASGQATHGVTGYNSGGYNSGYSAGMSDAGYSPNVVGFPARNGNSGPSGYAASSPYGDSWRSGDSRGSPAMPSPPSSGAISDPVGYGVAGRQPQRGPDARFRPYPFSDDRVS